MSIVLIDLSELIKHPLRTGIQRVERELLRRWPGPRPLIPVVFDKGSGGLATLPDGALAILAGGGGEPEASGEDGIAAERVRFASLVAEARPAAPMLDGDTLFNPELFQDADRAAFYRALPEGATGRVKWLVYDFLPYLRPQFFARGTGRHIMHYIRALRTVPDVAFISEETRADYQRAIMRSRERDGPVFPLGGDGLGLPRQRFDSMRRDFVVLGTIEPRKNVAAIIDSFEALWAEGVTIRLVVLGRMMAACAREQALIEKLAGSPNFTFIEQADEQTVRQALSRARALVCASEAEGFGLPPYEALSVGIPVIVPEGMPSIRLLAPDGQIRLPRTDAPTIAAAVRRLCDDATASRLWEAAARLHVPTWNDFASAVAAWLHEP